MFLWHITRPQKRKEEGSTAGMPAEEEQTADVHQLGVAVARNLLGSGGVADDCGDSGVTEVHGVLRVQIQCTLAVELATLIIACEVHGQDGQAVCKNLDLAVLSGEALGTGRCLKGRTPRAGGGGVLHRATPWNGGRGALEDLESGTWGKRALLPMLEPQHHRGESEQHSQCHDQQPSLKGKKSRKQNR